MEIWFTPKQGSSGPTLRISPGRGGLKPEFFFQCLDSRGLVEVETSHATFSDALIQVARRMAVDGHLEYEIEAP